MNLKLEADGLSRGAFGVMPDGRTVDAFWLRGPRGIKARVLTLGATLQSLLAPDHRGEIKDIALGYPKVDDYLVNREYFGVTLGRYANRIAGGNFELDGKVYSLAANDPPNSLHGGIGGFGRALWNVHDLRTGANPAITLGLSSPDGDDGYPGMLQATASFELRDDALMIRYRATADRPTIVNLSNHTYFNLAGEDSAADILGHELTLPAAAFLPVDSTSIPTGDFRDVAGTPFDFRTPTQIGQRIRVADPQLLIAKGYDHSWRLCTASLPEPRLVAHVRDPKTGRVLEVSSNQPALQFYSGNQLDGTSVGKSGHAYGRSDGFSLEPQLFPDTPNQPRFGSARLAPGGVYENTIIYRLTVA